MIIFFFLQRRTRARRSKISLALGSSYVFFMLGRVFYFYSKESQVLDKSQGEAIARLKGARERSDRLEKERE